MIFSAEDRVDLEKEQKIKDTAICQQKVDAILFGIYFISSNIVICFILVISVRVVFTLVTVIYYFCGL